ncbi:NAD-dependent malic enzyme 1, mitochondrial-like [Phragmites australis]|uniref:NAD-dependent malic enzyme 1, mitochondrial-like n=1 Tax=Phragmites australis TaxID=29695 RepID=UPI002D79DE7C|nr:NAD-dependent malic enzyme 1, mitochondrial-like [Phragmites australis]
MSTRAGSKELKAATKAFTNNYWRQYRCDLSLQEVEKNHRRAVAKTRDALATKGPSILPTSPHAPLQNVDDARNVTGGSEQVCAWSNTLSLPFGTETLDVTQNFLLDLKWLQKYARDGPSDTYPLAKWRILNRLHDRNETMYHKVLIDNIEEYAPLVYTPTVGLVCQNYSGLFQRPRGMYFSAEDRGGMMSMVYNWQADQVDMIVVTDGSRILGLGDLGVHGIGIAIRKLDLYVAAAGINPQRVLPVMIDVGRNNEKLLKDPLYKILIEYFYVH